MKTMVCPRVAERAENDEELAHLARGQDTRGLVEDEDLRAAVEHLDDLDALLKADGEILDALVGVESKDRTRTRAA